MRPPAGYMQAQSAVARVHFPMAKREIYRADAANCLVGEVDGAHGTSQSGMSGAVERATIRDAMVGVIVSEVADRRAMAQLGGSTTGAVCI